jgi:hypothetical protein
VGGAVLEHAFIAAAVSIFMIALTGKLAVGELACILAAFGEYINAKTIDTVTLNTFSKGYGREDEQYKTIELQ